MNVDRLSSGQYFPPLPLRPVPLVLSSTGRQRSPHIPPPTDLCNAPSYPSSPLPGGSFRPRPLSSCPGRPLQCQCSFLFVVSVGKHRVSSSSVSIRNRNRSRCRSRTPGSLAGKRKHCDNSSTIETYKFNKQAINHQPVLSRCDGGSDPVARNFTLVWYPAGTSIVARYVQQKSGEVRALRIECHSSQRVLNLMMFHEAN